MQKTNYSGRTLEGRYRVLELIGRGGMGSVYLGQHAFIGRKVAIKVLHSQFTGSEEMVTRFYREARAAAAIGHRNIIEVLDVGATDEGDPYLVMEYLRGESLGTMLKRTGPIDLAAACGILEPAIKALSAAHKEGIVHRDLKPDNIFLVYRPEEATEVKLIDFGISKIAPTVEHTKLTQTGHLIGTPAYMSPEQARGKTDVDLRSDIYSMGVILYELLSGKLPYQGQNYNALLAAILANESIPPTEANQNFPTEAIPVVQRAMSPEPDDRYQSATQMLEHLKSLAGFDARQERLDILASGISAATLAAGDLGRLITGDEDSDGLAREALAKIASASTPSEWAELNRPRKRRWTTTIVLGAILVAAVAIVFFTQRGPSQDPVPKAPVTKPTAAPATTVNGNPAAKKTVEIKVEGAPEGAEIFYDGSPVPMNPFRVRRGEGLVPFKVLAAGHKPFLKSLVPREDLVVEVELEPLAEQPDTAAAAAADAEEADKAKAKQPGKKGKGASTKTGKGGKDDREDGFIKAFK